eukprot:1016053-Prymnesium_polylepis.2
MGGARPPSFAQLSTMNWRLSVAPPKSFPTDRGHNQSPWSALPTATRKNTTRDHEDRRQH